MHAAVRYMSLAVAALVAASVSAAAQSNAQRSTTGGLTMDLHLNGSSIKVEGGSNESGGGIGARMGWGFTRSMSAYLGFDHARINSADQALADNYGLNQLDLGLQYSFMNNDRAWRPFVEAAATRRSLNADVNDQGTTYNMSTYGYGMTLGGGFQYFFSAPWALTTGLDYSFGRFTHASVDGQSGSIDPVSAQGARLNVGMSWHPMARR